MPDLPSHTSVKTYSSDFPLDESPVSEGGIWINGLADGIDWADCVTNNGMIHGGPTRMQVAEKRSEQAALGAGTDGFRSVNYSPMLSLWWLITGKTVAGSALRERSQI